MDFPDFLTLQLPEGTRYIIEHLEDPKLDTDHHLRVQNVAFAIVDVDVGVLLPWLCRIACYLQHKEAEFFYPDRYYKGIYCFKNSGYPAEEYAFFQTRILEVQGTICPDVGYTLSSAKQLSVLLLQLDSSERSAQPGGKEIMGDGRTTGPQPSLARISPVIYTLEATMNVSKSNNANVQLRREQRVKYPSHDFIYGEVQCA